MDDWENNFKNKFKWIVGDGQNIKFWNDKWIGYKHHKYY